MNNKNLFEKIPKTFFAVIASCCINLYLSFRFLNSASLSDISFSIESLGLIHYVHLFALFLLLIFLIEGHRFLIEIKSIFESEKLGVKYQGLVDWILAKKPADSKECLIKMRHTRSVVLKYCFSSFDIKIFSALFIMIICFSILLMVCQSNALCVIATVGVNIYGLILYIDPTFKENIVIEKIQLDEDMLSDKMSPHPYYLFHIKDDLDAKHQAINQFHAIAKKHKELEALCRGDLLPTEQ